MITCIKCGGFISYDWSNLSHECSDCEEVREAVHWAHGEAEKYLIMPQLVKQVSKEE